ncbi:glycosyl hydrolase family 18 protein [Veillonella montpellierensis]|uniref:glycosyl hydrolase family 18 protein n=1 Tax=Veillonella montpellierensis TaxID=187328 RepID=UPI0003FB7DB1|nr:glycosyl hydrolase family 18 protein [Veillonella montpellierensis]
MIKKIITATFILTVVTVNCLANDEPIINDIENYSHTSVNFQRMNEGKVANTFTSDYGKLITKEESYTPSEMEKRRIKGSKKEALYEHITIMPRKSLARDKMEYYKKSRQQTDKMTIHIDSTRPYKNSMMDKDALLVKNIDKLNESTTEHSTKMKKINSSVVCDSHVDSKPIYVTTSLLQLTNKAYKKLGQGLIRNSQVLIPLDVYLQITTLEKVHAIESATDKIMMLVPRLDLQDTYVRFSQDRTRTKIEVPLITIDNIKYINGTIGNGILGVIVEEGKNGIYIKPSYQSWKLREKNMLHTPISWAFDPYPSKPYKKSLTANQQSVISPSWFELGVDGIIPNKGMNIDYVMSYGVQKYQVWPLITNQFDPDITHTILHSPRAWKIYAQQLIQYALIYGFSGYNFDFENIYLKDKEQLVDFVAYLNEELHKYNLYTSIDVTGYSDSPNWSLVYDRYQLSKNVDYVVLMAYDETWATSPKPGPVASYPWVKRNVTDILQEVPANKLVLGIPFYTRIWTTTNNITKGRTLTIKDSMDYLSKYKDSIWWDDILKTHRLEIYDGKTMSGNEKHVNSLQRETVKKRSKIVESIWFEDVDSLQYKLELIKNLSLAGFAAWRKDFETEDILDFIYHY